MVKGVKAVGGAAIDLAGLARLSVSGAGVAVLRIAVPIYRMGNDAIRHSRLLPGG